MEDALPRLANAAAALLLALLLPMAGVAQAAEGTMTLDVDPDAGTATLRVGNLLEERELGRALESGLPLRIRIVTELWRKRLFDAQEGRAEWRASVVYDPLERQYRVETGDSGGEVITLETREEAGHALQRSFEAPLGPGVSGRYYYLATVEVETLSLSDLEELQRWLRGDLAPAVGGEGEVDGALARGFRRIFVRILALPVRRFELRSPTFRHERSPGSAAGPTSRAPDDTGLDVRAAESAPAWGPVRVDDVLEEQCVERVERVERLERLSGASRPRDTIGTSCASPPPATSVRGSRTPAVPVRMNRPSSGVGPVRASDWSGGAPAR